VAGALGEQPDKRAVNDHLLDRARDDIDLVGSLYSEACDVDH